MILGLGLAAGCGASDSMDARQQAENAKRVYEQQQPKSQTKLSAKDRRTELQRLRMKFGDVAE